MSQWISISEAAYKYGIDEEDIRLWIEKREITFVPVGTTYIVDDESIQELLSQHQVIPTKEYISSIIQIYKNELGISQAFQEINSINELEIIELKKEISVMQKIQDAMESNNKAYKKINVLLKEDSFIRMKWLANIWRKLKHIILK